MIALRCGMVYDGRHDDEGSFLLAQSEALVYAAYPMPMSEEGEQRYIVVLDSESSESSVSSDSGSSDSADPVSRKARKFVKRKIAGSTAGEAIVTSTPKKNLRDFFSIVSAHEYLQDLDDKLAVDILDLRHVGVVPASALLQLPVARGDAAVASYDVESECPCSTSESEPDIKRKNGYALDVFLVDSEYSSDASAADEDRVALKASQMVTLGKENQHP